MIFEKILNFLTEFFIKSDPDKKFIDNMRKILSKLKHKAQKLEVQLENEKNKGKRRNINIMLKVIYKKQVKGKKILHEMEKSSHPSRKHTIIIKPNLSPPIL